MYRFVNRVSRVVASSVWSFSGSSSCSSTLTKRGFTCFSRPMDVQKFGDVGGDFMKWGTLGSCRKSSFASGFTPLKPKPLGSIIDIRRAELQSPEDLADIWDDFHLGRGHIGASMKASLYNLFKQRAADCRYFVMPLRKGSGYTTMFAQVQIPHMIFTGLEDYKARGTEATPYFTVSYYTEFAESKDLVLIRGDIVFASKLTDDEAKSLLETTQSFYLNDNRVKIVIMGSGGWLKKIIGSKKEKNVNAKSLKECSQKESSNTSNNTADEKLGAVVPFDDIAAIRIQSAFRAYKARKFFRHLKGTSKLRAPTLDSSVSKQASATLRHLHAWSKIQSEIRTRRICMATEARIRQKNLDNQLKLDAKLHDLEVEWDCGTKTMEEYVTSIYLREAAAVKRERTMAYAFSHQWRANSNLVLNNNEFGNAIWGWSWTERWMAARPWESRALVQSSPKKTVSKQSSKNIKNLKSPTMKPMLSVKSISPNGKGTIKIRKLSYGKPDQEAIANKEHMAC